MGIFDGVLLVSDYDDTLCDNNGQIPVRNLRALEQFTARGGRFTVATGRAYTTFAPYVHALPINAPVILSNGSALYDFRAGQMLMQTQLDSRAPEDMTALMEVEPGLGFEAYHGEDIYVFRPNWVTDAHMKKVGTSYTLCSVEAMPTPWTKAIVQGEHEELLRARTWLSEHCPGRYEAIFSNHYYLEITQVGSNKGGMAVQLARMLDIDRKNIFCIGDNQNDIPMLAQSAIPFAPADCAQEVKDWGARLLCPCEEGAVAQAIGIIEKERERH
ncbi:MAG: HAD-IIB family hydrolase [Oscillospiraceae bacterium]|nr:HAD-IIB family hydrolase [Oscillospiraceae bacterium]